MKENFISKDIEEESGAKVNPVDANKTLYIDQFSSDVTVGDPEFFQEGRTMQDVFDHFKPEVDAEFIDNEGATVTETLKFRSIADFEANGGKGNLVKNSPYLSGLKLQVDNAAKVRKQIEQNGKLKSILKDAEGREELRQMLRQMLDELEQSK